MTAVKMSKKLLLSNFDRFPPELQASIRVVLSENEKLRRENKKLKNNSAANVINLPNKIWSDILDYEGLYQVSNFARVKSFHGGEEKILKALLNSANYFYVCLKKNDVAQNFLIHRLVTQAFIPNPEDKPQVNHIDGNKN